MSEEENKAVVQRFWAEVIDPHGGYVEAIEDVWAADLVWHGPHILGTVHGKAAFEKIVVAFETGFPDVKVTPEKMLVDGDLVTTRYTWRGTHRGEFMGIPPTGRSVTVTGISIYRVANGKIVEEWFQQDWLGVMAQIGALPLPGEDGSSAAGAGS